MKAPLLVERGLIEFEAGTAEGCLRCMLDTGATCNILNAEIPLDQTVQTANHLWNCTIFQISGKNFGPVAFQQFPINLPIRIEAILGVEFFKEHIVFLDFLTKCICFAKIEETCSTVTSCQFGEGEE